MLNFRPAVNFSDLISSQAGVHLPHKRKLIIDIAGNAVATSGYDSIRLVNFNKAGNLKLNPFNPESLSDEQVLSALAVVATNSKTENAYSLRQTAIFSLVNKDSAHNRDNINGVKFPKASVHKLDIPVSGKKLKFEITPAGDLILPGSKNPIDPYISGIDYSVNAESAKGPDTIAIQDFRSQEPDLNLALHGKKDAA